MIRAKSHGEFSSYYAAVPGSAQVFVAGTGVGGDNFLVPFSGFLRAYWASFAVGGTDGTGAPTQNIVVDILQNGTSIFTAGNGNKINWSHALQTGVAVRLPDIDGVFAGAEPLQVTAGDQFSVRILQILNGTTPTQPIDLNVGFLFTRRMSPPAQHLFNTFLLDVDN